MNKKQLARSQSNIFLYRLKLLRKFALLLIAIVAFSLIISILPHLNLDSFFDFSGSSVFAMSMVAGFYNSNIEFIDKYNTVVQHHVLLSDTQNLLGEVGRGSGKTTEMFAPRIVRITYDMPRSTMLLVAPTYTFAMDTIVPGIITYLGKHYTRGIHYEYGKEPPKHFKRPLTPVGSWKHTISFAWGTVLLFGSLDRPESIIGKSVVHVFVDELLRIKETDFVERVFPTLREDREIYGHSHYFGGMTGFSSTPNFENDEDWWTHYEENVNRSALDLIEYIAFRTLKAEGELLNAEVDLEEARK